MAATHEVTVEPESGPRCFRDARGKWVTIASGTTGEATLTDDQVADLIRWMGPGKVRKIKNPASAPRRKVD